MLLFCKDSTHPHKEKALHWCPSNKWIATSSQYPRQNKKLFRYPVTKAWSPRTIAVRIVNSDDLLFVLPFVRKIFFLSNNAPLLLIWFLRCNLLCYKMFASRNVRRFQMTMLFTSTDKKDKHTKCRYYFFNRWVNSHKAIISLGIGNIQDTSQLANSASGTGGQDDIDVPSGNDSVAGAYSDDHSPEMLYRWEQSILYYWKDVEKKPLGP